MLAGQNNCTVRCSLIISFYHGLGESWFEDIWRSLWCWYGRKNFSCIVSYKVGPRFYLDELLKKTFKRENKKTRKLASLFVKFSLWTTLQQNFGEVVCKILEINSWQVYLLNILHTWAGIEVSTEDIKQAVSEVVEENKATILELRYRTNGRCSVFAHDGFSNSILTDFITLKL